MIEIFITHNKDIADMFRWTRPNIYAYWIGFGNDSYKLILPPDDAIIFKLRFNV